MARAPLPPEQLLEREDGDFVASAYRVLLHRDPDSGGYAHHLGQLRLGTSKLEIIHRIRYSPEGRNVAADMRGLRFRLAVERLCRVSLIGRPIRAAIGFLARLSVSLRSAAGSPARREKHLYYFVDPVVRHPDNDGSQTNARHLARALHDSRVPIRFVKWDRATSRLVLPSRADLRNLTNGGGPALSSGELRRYPARDGQAESAAVNPSLEDSWLIVPGDRRLVDREKPVALDVIMAAKRSGLRTAFIFQDAMPLRRPDLKEMAAEHQVYMQHLMLADMVLPLSDSSAGDLVSLWRVHEEAVTSSLPQITVISQPGELRLAPRSGQPAAITTPVGDWLEYSRVLMTSIARASDPLLQIGVIYYFIDHTVQFDKNTGIQRVTRQLAKSLMRIGLRLVPVKWDQANSRFYPPATQELEFFARWNGPQPSGWSQWVDPALASRRDWVLIPEVIHYLGKEGMAALKQYASGLGLRCAWIFFDAIPWKMREMFWPEFTEAHRVYMEGVLSFEKILSISDCSRNDLVAFMAGTRLRAPNLEQRVETCELPGEFPEIPQVAEVKSGIPDVIRILCVGTVEPRKNHLALLRAYGKVISRASKPVELCIAGRITLPDLAAQVRQYVDAMPGVRWEQDADDARLRELYAQCDFTVYPSLEEGFGLPILESLWSGRPCICRNSGVMAEVAAGGGCLTVETANPDRLTKAILSLVEDDARRNALAVAAVERKYKTWDDYAREVAARLAAERCLPPPQHAAEPLTRGEVYRQLVNIAPRPLLSICITTYNRGAWLALSLKNLARMLPGPREDIEIVVCDNASTDHTPAVVQPYLHRSDFRYCRNERNVGMLGNLRVTAHHARGRYIWILGDDDLVKPGGLERVVAAIKANPGVALIYLNYAYTREADAAAVTDLDAFLAKSTPIVAPEADTAAPIRRISARTENFFTAIYCLVFRRDHALRAYSQNTEGRPFSTMLTCIPTTHYVLNYMMDEPGCWIGEPQVVVNMNVSWMRYAPLWILERIPEVYDVAEKMGADPQSVDRWRVNNMQSVAHFFPEILRDDPEGNAEYFSPMRLVNRLKHLDEFRDIVPGLREAYGAAHLRGHPAAKVPPSTLFACCDLSVQEH